MSNIFVSVFLGKTSLEQLHDRLRELGEQKKKQCFSDFISSEIGNKEVKQCVIGPNHIAFLLDDKKVCRLKFILNQGKGDEPTKDDGDDENPSGPSRTVANVLVHSAARSSRSELPFTISGETLSTLSGQLGRWGSSRTVTSAGTANRPTTTIAGSAASASGGIRVRGRIVRAAMRGRSGNSWLSTRPVIPASAVPEELVAQAQVVLQGKSRNTIIRELQRTNLDVNLAVNNLLSRDDDETDEHDDSSEAYIPGDDLISIFDGEDNSFFVDPDSMFPEEIIYGSSLNRPVSRTGRRTASNEGTSRGESERERDISGTVRQCEKYYLDLLNIDQSGNKSGKSKGNQKNKSSTASEQIHVIGDVEFWKANEEETESSMKFSHIAALHSELIAVGLDGKLHQWKWSDPHPMKSAPGQHSHSRAADLKLKDEKIVALDACNIRASVLTESGKVATWLDETLSAVAFKLEHAAQIFPEFRGQTVNGLHVCDLYSCVQLGNGSLYWWGVFPFEQRRKLMDKVKQKAKKSAISGSSLIQAGTQVCLRSCPLYYPGAVGFTTINGQPKVGELLEQAWTITEKCRFKILKNGRKEKEDEASSEDKDKSEDGEPLEIPKKRKRPDDDVDDETTEKNKEEHWNLKDVIFVEDVRNVPVGKVLKVDGAYALVNFSDNTPSSQNANDELSSLLKSCRLVRKDELQIVRWTTPPKMSECFQKVPKQLSVPGNCKVLSMALDMNGVHTLLKSPSTVRYAVFSLASGRVEPGGTIPPEAAAVLSSAGTGNPVLYTAGMDSLIVLRDGNGCVFPLDKDCIGGIKDPNWVNLSPITCLCMGSRSFGSGSTTMHLTLAVIVVKNQLLMKSIGNCDIESIKENLESLEKDKALAEQVMNEKCDGNRNLIHKAVSCCFPSSAKSKQNTNSKPADKDSIAQANLVKSLDLTQRNTSRDLDDIFPIDLPIPTTSWPPERTLQESQPTDDNDEGASKWLPVGEKSDSLTCFNTVVNHSVVASHLLNLLREKDATGCTPFMLAVRGRAYSAALLLFETAKKQATKDDTLDQDLFISMIYPSVDSSLSPFHMICCNDTCSFTWTGTTHINQDIFECRTCGLLGTLCCCTECASVCHIGHDCKLKRTSPTAYCDCWEKCACKALIPGEQKSRLELLKRLISETDLATKPNKDGEHILLFLAKTVARQSSEQGQYNSNKPSVPKSRTNTVRSIGTPALPAHDLEPPKFAKLALEHTLKDWRALRSMLMFGSNVDEVKSRSQAVDDTFANMIGSSILSHDEQIGYLKSQEGTARLDSFVHCLLVKCNAEQYLKTLLKTLETVIADAEEKNDPDPLLVARRFVRSVCRVFVVLTSSLGPSSNKRKTSPSLLLPFMKCKRVFVSLNVIAVKELASVAAALFAPVRLGVVYPSAPFTLSSLASDGSQACDELFSVLPLLSRTGTETSRGHHVRFESNQLERDEEHIQSNRTEGMEMDILSQEEHSSQGMALESQEQHASNDGDDMPNAESDMEIDLLAESESESDDSNADDVDDNQRGSSSNVAANRQSHSRSDMDDNRRSHDNETVDYYSGDESTAEVDDDEDGEIEDETDDVYETSIEPIVHRLISGSSRTPHALQWAVRNAQRPDGGAEAHGYIGTANIRRSASGASASADISSAGNNVYSMPSALARTFGIVVRELADILALSGDSLMSYCIPLKQADLKKARSNSDVILDDTWKWLWKVMETTETQLRFGASLTAVSDPAHPHHPLHGVQMKKGDRRRDTNSLLSVARNWNPDPKRKRRGGNGNETSDSSLRHDFLSYLLSLMRGSDNEHGDSLPKLEVTSLQHVAYILDAFVYYLRSKMKSEAEEVKQDGLIFTNLLSCDSEVKKCAASKQIAEDSEEESETDEELPDENKETKTSLNRFFKRSDSTLVLGYEPSDPITVPMREALPLANTPHLLNPTARRDQLFGSTRSSNDELQVDIPKSIGYGTRITNAENCDPQPSTSSSLSRSIPEISRISANFILGRWRMCLELFGRLFLDDVGAEPHSVLNEIGRFDVKEAKFRRDMEKLRNNHQKDLYIEEVERDRTQLIKQTFSKLDAFFGRRGHSTVPVSIHRLRVSFKDEPGEGSGVVRSFYTAIGEALLSDEALPPLETIFTGTAKDENHPGLVLLAGLTQRLKSRVRERERRRGAGTAGSSGMMLTARMRRERAHAKLVMERGGRQKLNPDAKPYVYDPDMPDTSDNDEGDDNDPIKKSYLGRRLYTRVYAQQPTLANQITGMLLELSPTEILFLLTQEEILKIRITEAVTSLNAKEKADPTSAGSSQDSFTEKTSPEVDDDDYEDYLDNSPLFFQPGKTGFYSPRCGKISVERLNCYRNVGRLIGLCLLQNELSPMSFNRHVIKYILGREVSWHDLAFFDPTLYEVLRLLIQNSTRPDAKELFSGLDLTFYVDLSQDEGGSSKELVPNGKQKAVAPDNIQDYVKRYAEYRMITVAKKPLESLRRGVLDVLPAHTLEGLTAEDFRLLLNGSGNINVQQLMSYTSFSDETGGDSQDKLSKFKRWFWSIVESMTPKQKQEMLYFWTSSPAMPASSEGFQPMPSVTVKPANDHQLPTANTCISRLYIPLYSSKKILKSKLLLAIKTRTFGFV